MSPTDPKAVAAVESSQMDRARPIENSKMTRFHESITHHGIPFIIGTDTTATKAKDHRESLTHEQLITAQLLNAILDPPASRIAVPLLDSTTPAKTERWVG